jgi:hypothetical protein
MKLLIALASSAAVALAATPALAKSKNKYPRAQPGYYGQTYEPGYWAGYSGPRLGGSWRGNDPSLGHPSAASLSRASGRCVEDLGYGRFKYCGW